ncbi:MAG: hypothetical protein M1522_05095 [Actinobacteria bacterium]|jgi:hypothetical protein|nr:hypothetical protein [Actinomycetota bacterium]
MVTTETTIHLAQVMETVASVIAAFFPSRWARETATGCHEAVLVAKRLAARP